jgi:hypothetical protein
MFSFPKRKIHATSIGYMRLPTLLVQVSVFKKWKIRSLASDKFMPSHLAGSGFVFHFSHLAT